MNREAKKALIVVGARLVLTSLSKLGERESVVTINWVEENGRGVYFGYTPDKLSDGAWGCATWADSATPFGLVNVAPAPERVPFAFPRFASALVVLIVMFGAKDELGEAYSGEVVQYGPNLSHSTLICMENGDVCLAGEEAILDFTDKKEE